MGIYDTGNKTVDAVGKLNITGNIIPESWYKTIVKPKTGKPNLRAIIFLADIIYWYRPTEVRNEVTGQVIGYKKKMHGDLLQRSYLDWANKFGCSKREATTTIDELVSLGVVFRDWRTIEYKGMNVNNVQYLGLNVERLIELTYPDEMDSNEEEIGVTKKRDRVVRKKEIAYVQKADTNTKNKQETTADINHSFLQEQEERMTDEELSEMVEEELDRNDGIPYEYSRDINKMTSAIHYITDWNTYYPNGYQDIFFQRTFNLAIEALIEMASETGIKTYNKRRVTYANVIDKINQSIKGQPCKSIHSIIESAVEDYIKAANKNEIKYPRNYIKSCILDNFDTYEVKLGSYFNRTYYST
nr:hypothetical protein [uncultured Anaerocolumna sp.]